MHTTQEDPELQEAVAAAFTHMLEEKKKTLLREQREAESIYDLCGIDEQRFREKFFLRTQGGEDPPVLPPAGHLLNILFETVDPAGSFTEGSKSHLHWFIGGTARIPQFRIALEGTKLSLNFQFRHMLTVDLCDPDSLKKVRRYFELFPGKFRGWGRLPVRLRSTGVKS